MDAKMIAKVAKFRQILPHLVFHDVHLSLFPTIFTLKLPRVISTKVHNLGLFALNFLLKKAKKLKFIFYLKIAKMTV